MIYSCTCGWVGRHKDLGRFGQCPKCGEYDSSTVPEDKEETQMLARIQEGHEIFESALIRSGANAICWTLP